MRDPWLGIQAVQEGPSLGAKDLFGSLALEDTRVGVPISRIGPDTQGLDHHEQSKADAQDRSQKRIARLEEEMIPSSERSPCKSHHGFDHGIASRRTMKRI